MQISRLKEPNKLFRTSFSRITLFCIPRRLFALLERTLPYLTHKSSPILSGNPTLISGIISPPLLFVTRKITWHPYPFWLRWIDQITMFCNLYQRTPTLVAFQKIHFASWLWSVNVYNYNTQQLPHHELFLQILEVCPTVYNQVSHVGRTREQQRIQMMILLHVATSLQVIQPISRACQLIVRMSNVRNLWYGATAVPWQLISSTKNRTSGFHSTWHLQLGGNGWISDSAQANHKSHYWVHLSHILRTQLRHICTMNLFT